jgi:hypothetical protein
MERTPPTTTPRSELQSIGRTMEPPRGGEARAEREQTVMPWVRMLIGLLVVMGFVAALIVIGPSKEGTRKEATVFSTEVRHP